MGIFGSTASVNNPVLYNDIGGHNGVFRDIQLIRGKILPELSVQCPDNQSGVICKILNFPDNLLSVDNTAPDYHI